MTDRKKKTAFFQMSKEGKGLRQVKKTRGHPTKEFHHKNNPNTITYLTVINRGLTLCNVY